MSYVPKQPTPTRFELPDGQRLAYIQWAKDWRIVHIDPSNHTDYRSICRAFVGPIYRTKAELLSDLDRYAKEFGF